MVQPPAAATRGAGGARPCGRERHNSFGPSFTADSGVPTRRRLSLLRNSPGVTSGTAWGAMADTRARPEERPAPLRPATQAQETPISSFAAQSIRMVPKCGGRRCSPVSARGDTKMDARKIAAAAALVLSLHVASALAAGAGRDATRTHAVPGSPRSAGVPAKRAPGAKAQKTPAIRRTPPRERSTDLELPQLG